MSESGDRSESNDRLVAIQLDEKTIGRATADIEHERDIAIYDLIEENAFSLPGIDSGPYALRLSIIDNRLVFEIRHANGAEDVAAEPLTTLILSLRPFRRIVKDYYLVCESYFTAIKTAPASQIEAIDMGRRGLHDEGSQILLERLNGKVDTNFETARRLFTLICVLHWRGS